MTKQINVNPNFSKVGGREKRLLSEQKGKGTRAIPGGMRDGSKKK